jgi:hypothetical protein
MSYVRGSVDNAIKPKYTDFAPLVLELASISRGCHIGVTDDRKFYN